MALAEFCGLPWGYPHRVAAGYDSGRGGDGNHRRKTAAADFSVSVANSWENMGDSAASWQKNFAFCENFDCIWRKMGYNKME